MGKILERGPAKFQTPNSQFQKSKCPTFGNLIGRCEVHRFPSTAALRCACSEGVAGRLTIELSLKDLVIFSFGIGLRFALINSAYET
jgi:hypothetical protein